MSYSLMAIPARDRLNKMIMYLSTAGNPLSWYNVLFAHVNLMLQIYYSLFLQIKKIKETFSPPQCSVHFHLSVISHVKHTCH